jgi:amino acid adenylation domain-containing protein
MVALLLDRGTELPVAQLAVMKAGACWVLLDPQLPAARLAFQAGDADAALVLTTTDLAAQAPTDVRHWCLDDPALGARLAAQPSTPPAVAVGPADPAYLLYTSGSTGTPKGVLVSHRSAYAYCQNAVELFGTSAADRVAQVSNPAFDASVFDCFASLLAGATLIGVPREALADPAALTALLRAEQVTIAYLPPAILALLDPEALAGTVLRAAFSAGEALPAEQVRRWSRPGFALHNSYGPTETTVVCTDYLCPTTAPAGSVPIGTALPNHRAYVLDRRLRPVPIGVPGYLYIAGSGVAHGYLKRPALTAQRFLPDPYGDRPGERMYATGDLVRWRSSGVLEYQGRGDRQVKLRGQRVELGEIEHAMVQHPGVRQSAVVLHEHATLAAYFVGEAGIDEVREFLAERLPAYMVPTAWVVLTELPISPNGKLDTARLPDPAPAARPAYRPPTTGTERWLASVWQDLLVADRVGATDNFFDLGGNSLHTTRLTARIRDHFDIQLHPQHLFNSPTLEHLARLLDRGVGAMDRAGDRMTGVAIDEVADAGVVTLRARGGRPPLFLIHAVGGSATPYAQLASMLGDDRPVHVIEDPGLRGLPLADSLSERATRYVELIRRIWPDGPYLLGGWSFGGVVGVEMARQLSHAGATVPVVVALDSQLTAPGHRATPEFVWRAFVGDVAAAAGVAPPHVDAEVLRGLDGDEVEELALDELDRAGLAGAELREELRLRMRVVAANQRALYGYQLAPYGGRVVLVRAADSDAPLELSRWRPATNLQLITVAGNHYSILRPPQLSQVAALLREALGD